MSELHDRPVFLAGPETEVAARRAATRLRNALRMNTGFSLLIGLAALVAGGPIADVLGVEQVWLVRSLGAGLLGFAAFVLWVASARTTTLTPVSRLISFADFGWVAGTAALIAAGWLSTAGAIVIGLIAFVVLKLGINQLRRRTQLIADLRASDDGINELPAIEVIEFSQPSPFSAEVIWPVITDHDLYAKLALNLKAASGLTPNGPGFQRTCTDPAGRTWSETCTLWDPGHRFDVSVDASDYPYPLGLVEGSWRVEPGERAGSTIGMRFAIQPRPGLYGRLFVPLMHAGFAPILKRIARGWQKAAAHQPAAAQVGIAREDTDQQLDDR